LRRSRINLLRLKEELSEVKLRLATVTVAYFSWQEFIPLLHKQHGKGWLIIRYYFEYHSKDTVF